MKLSSIFILCLLLVSVALAETWQEARARHARGNFIVSENEFEYVVVGAGPGGCAVSATLTEKGKKVLLLERGLPRSENWMTQTILGWPDVVNSEAAEYIRTKNGVWTITAKSMGGATSLNGGAFLFEKRSFWEKYTNRFDIDAIYNAYQWVKDRLPHRLPYGEYGKARLKACNETGFEQYGFHDYPMDNPFGTQTLWATFREKDGVLIRNAADVLLNMEKNPLITLRTEAEVTNIEFVDGATPDKPPRASCVQYNWKNKVYVICPKNEIIMSAGAIWTPFLLMKSGIGPAENLKNYGVNVIKDVPDIGKNLHDKPVVTLVTFFNWDMKEIPFTAIETACTEPTPFMVEQTSGGNITSSFGIAELALVPPEYRLEALRTALKLIMDTPGPIKTILNHSTQFPSLLYHPYSRGSLKLKRDRNHDLVPDVDFNYFSDPRDLNSAIYALKKLEQIVNAPALQPWLYRKEKDMFTTISDAVYLLAKDLHLSNLFNWAACELLPEGQVVTLPCTPDITDDEAIKRWLMTYMASGYHIAGSMEIGQVLDKDFRVIGVDNLRVADASILPQITEVNPQATIEMIGRYAGLRILKIKDENHQPSSHFHNEL